MTNQAENAPLLEGGNDPSPSLLPMLILELILNGDEAWGVTDLARALGIPKARAHRHAAALKASGFLAQDPGTRRYEPGWRLVLLGQHIARRADLLSIAKPILERLRDRVGQTVVLSQLTEVGVTVTEVLPGGSPIDVILSPGTTFGYNSSAQGKVALAFGAESQVEAWRELTDEQRTPASVTDHDLLWKQVEETSQRGWTSAPEETYRGINAIAAPVLRRDKSLACTLCVVGSIHYLPEPVPDNVIDAVLTACSSLSAELGYRTDADSHEKG